MVAEAISLEERLVDVVEAAASLAAVDLEASLDLVESVELSEPEAPTDPVEESEPDVEVEVLLEGVVVATPSVRVESLLELSVATLPEVDVVEPEVAPIDEDDELGVVEELGLVVDEVVELSEPLPAALPLALSEPDVSVEPLRPEGVVEVDEAVRLVSLLKPLVEEVEDEGELVELLAACSEEERLPLPEAEPLAERP